MRINNSSDSLSLFDAIMNEAGGNFRSTNKSKIHRVRKYVSEHTDDYQLLHLIEQYQTEERNPTELLSTLDQLQKPDSIFTEMAKYDFINGQVVVTDEARKKKRVMSEEEWERLRSSTEKNLIGMITSAGIKITGFSGHLLADIAIRSGRDSKKIAEVLKTAKSTQERHNANYYKYVFQKIRVIVDHSDGRIISVY